ncbi:META and DUF4377 domain-containing protein [Vandammella animalimorsus]|nr:META and DUF4377 domain-containing protein [Vandammella animalimorsus]
MLAALCCGMLTACATGVGAAGAPGASGNGPAQPGQPPQRDLFAQAGSGHVGAPLAHGAAPAQAMDALTAYHWQLRAVTGRDGAWFGRGQRALRAPVQLRFDGQYLGVSGLCNLLSATYLAGPDQLRVDVPMQTKKACADQRLMTLEQQLAAALPQVRSWRISGPAHAPQLRLEFANGSQWQLDGAPTHATRHGAAPQTIFLEVAPRTRPCSEAGRTRQCLEVRRVDFDAQGLRQSSGPWELFHEPIEGFTHEPGVRSLLRIHRYPARGGRPGVASPYVYVLDETVGAEWVQPQRP